MGEIVFRVGKMSLFLAFARLFQQMVNIFLNGNDLFALKFVSPNPAEVP